MDAKTICIQQLAHLSTATIMGRKAPHKAVLLLAIMDLVETGIIVMPQFVLSEQLEETFKKEWYRYIGSPLIFKCKVSTPFWHMQNEPFYSLFLKTGENISSFRNNYSVCHLRNETYAVIDDDMFMLMQNEKIRLEFRQILIKTYLQGLHSDMSMSQNQND